MVRIPIKMNKQDIGQEKKTTWQIFVFGLLIFACYLMIFKNYFPNKNGGMGHDYSYFIPHMLSGFYWFKTNGILSIPWFTPAFCGGSIVFPNPACTYFSAPQFLAFLVDPFQSVLLTFIIFAAIGFLGFYYLLRKIFSCSPWAALLGGTLFLYNGFYIYRIIVGHIFAHSFMLIPCIGIFLFYLKEHGIVQDIFFGMLAGLLFAYIFYTGGGGYLPIPMFLSLVVMGLICVILHLDLIPIIRRWIFFIISICLFSCAKLSAILFTMSNLSRSEYPLMGIPNFLDALLLPFRTLFVNALQWEETQRTIANLFVKMDCHEFEYGITMVPLLLIIIGCAKLLYKGRPWSRTRKKNILFSMLIAVIFIIPVFFNYSTPKWQEIIKKIPLLAQYSAFFRWYILYIPPVIIISVIIFERLKLRYIIKKLLSLVLIMIIIGMNIIHNKSFYDEQSYDPKPILDAYQSCRKKHDIRPIKYLGTGIMGNPVNDDRIMIYGVSQIDCYEPIFGYWNEFLPGIENLKPGSVEKLENGYFNIKNPVCYTFPEANSCKPGDHFRYDQQDMMLDFINYKSFDFIIPFKQRVANRITLFSLIGFLILMTSYFFKSILICLKRNHEIH